MHVNTRLTVLIGALASSGLLTGAAAAAEAPTGVWIDHTGRGGVEIKDCGNGKLCGHVVWLKDSKDAKGCGLQILGDVAPIGGGQWDNGWVYSPEKKQKFSVELTPLDDNRLRVKGYKGIKLLSRTMIWHRASDSLQRCDKQTVARANPQPTAKSAAKPDTPAERDSDNTTAREDNNKVRTPDRSEPQEQSVARANPANQDQPTNGQAFRADENAVEDRVAPPPRDRASPYKQEPNDSPYADGTPPEQQPDNKGKLDGLAGLLESFSARDGVDAGNGYGMKVEEGPRGEKNCHLNVPFVTVRFPCDD